MTSAVHPPCPCLGCHQKTCREHNAHASLRVGCEGSATVTVTDHRSLEPRGNRTRATGQDACTGEKAPVPGLCFLTEKTHPRTADGTPTHSFGCIHFSNQSQVVSFTSLPYTPLHTTNRQPQPHASPQPHQCSTTLNLPACSSMEPRLEAERLAGLCFGMGR